MKSLLFYLSLKSVTVCWLKAWAVSSRDSYNSSLLAEPNMVRTQSLSLYCVVQQYPWRLMRIHPLPVLYLPRGLPQVESFCRLGTQAVERQVLLHC